MTPTYIRHQTIALALEHNNNNKHLQPIISNYDGRENHWMFSGSAPDSGGEGNEWKFSRIAVPATEAGEGPYPPRERDEMQPRPGMGSRMKSAEQLPPLSSIFHDSGPRMSLPSLTRGSNAAPSFTPRSPRTTQRPSGERLSQHYWEEAPYSRPASQPSSQFAYSRASHAPTTSELPPPPPRSQHDISTASSPGYFDPTKAQSQERGRPHTSSIPWPPQIEPVYRENYHSGATSPYEHAGGAREQPQPRGYLLQLASSDSSRQQLEISMLQSSGRTSQQSASGKSTKSSAKDTLGPKIWTGTHFLPRFVRQAEVPGEGMCYFYDDGTYCKTVIDDEPVNAHWGVTKAGKPRKRLAIACITCREKKIKCDPDYPRCIQCEKFGRVCKFKNA